MLELPHGCIAALACALCGLFVCLFVFIFSFFCQPVDSGFISLPDAFLKQRPPASSHELALTLRLAPTHKMMKSNDKTELKTNKSISSQSCGGCLGERMGGGFFSILHILEL